MKRTILIVLVVLAVLFTGFLAIVKIGLNHLRTEDEVPHTYNPVLVALSDYSDINGVCPSMLSDLVPAFLPSVPTSDVVRRIEHTRTPDHTNWIMIVEANVHKDVWLYGYRTDDSVAWPTGWQNIGWLHSWEVFKKD